MKKHLSPERGFTLLELMIYMSIMVILVSGLLTLFSASLHIWTVEKSRTSMQQTARIAVDRIMREIRYAQDISLTDHSLKIIKPGGEINTFQLGGELHESTLYMTIDKTKVVPAGGISSNPITENVVTNLLFTPYPQRTNFQAVIITLEVTDKMTGQKQVIYTAGYPWNSR